jgi:hypothetical protein
VSQVKLHAWPNFEMAWYAYGHVRGTFLLDANQGPTSQWVDAAALPGQPPLYDIAKVFAAADGWAKQQPTLETAIPTFEQGSGPNGPTYELIVFPKNLAWLHHDKVDLSATYQSPTFAEPGVVIRNVTRVAPAVAAAAGDGYLASFPTFVPDDPNLFSGRKTVYDMYYLDDHAPVHWEDVPTSTYVSFV